MTEFLVHNNRVFIPSKQINIFPCSRRGGLYTYTLDDGHEVNAYYDPEARLNTERTNRISTAVNGFTDSFIESFENHAKKANVDGTETDVEVWSLTFVLAGYRAEIKDFDPAAIASALGATDNIYAYLSLHKNISLDDDDYATEILYSQPTGATNSAVSLDITYEGSDFFAGISFVASDNTNDTSSNIDTEPKHLLLFSKSESGDNWELVQTSLLPHIEHGETEDSVKVTGTLYVDNVASATNDNVPGGGTVWMNSPVGISGSLYVEHRVDVGTRVVTLEADNNGTDGKITSPDLSITKKATINNLVVGNRSTGDSSDAGVLTAKTKVVSKEVAASDKVEAPALVATTELKTPKITTSESSATTTIVGSGISTPSITTEELTATVLYQDIAKDPTKPTIRTTMTVPAIELAGEEPGPYQLQIFNIGKK